jgi:branched-chain amino acid transport system ATP-binding protein
MVDQPVIETQKLTKNFGALRAVSIVDLKVYPGQIHSIIGPNGAGKTTLFNLLTGSFPPTSGRIIFKEKEITGFPPHKVSKLGIGRSYQIVNIFPELSVLENVRIAIQSRTKINYHFLSSFRKLGFLEEKAREMLIRIGLKGKENILAKNLSHGEKRILDISVGLATEPSLLLLDEPASGLSENEKLIVTGLIHEIVNPITIILIEHNIDVVLNMSDRITVLNQGSVIAEGLPEEIQKNEKVQEAYLGEELT